MIRIASATDIRKLLVHVLAMPEQFERVVLCSPFLDDALIGMLGALTQAARRAQCGFRVVTRPSNSTGLLARLPGHPAQRRTVIVPVSKLHAKAYLAIGRRSADTRAIVSSANLTTAGLGKNLELGVLATPASDAGREMVSEVSEFLQRLVDEPQRLISINDSRRAA